MNIKAIQKVVTESDTTATLAGKIPTNAYPLELKIHVSEAFDSGGTNYLQVGTNSDDDYFAANVNVSSTGEATVTLLNPGEVISSTDETGVYIKFEGSGSAATAGSARVTLLYAFNE